MRAMMAIFAMTLAFVAGAQEAAAQYVEGKHYAVISKPVRTTSADKIEVSELFWYGCSACFRIEPLVQQWKMKAADDVAFVQSPAMWNKPMQLHARAFYAAQALKVLDKVHQPIFNAMNVNRKRLQNADEIFPFFAAAGIERAAFDKVFKSFGVTSQVKQADARARGYRITSTPELVVEGKYRVSSKMAGSHAEMLKVVDYLVAKVRAEKS